MRAVILPGILLIQSFASFFKLGEFIGDFFSFPLLCDGSHAVLLILKSLQSSWIIEHSNCFPWSLACCCTGAACSLCCAPFTKCRSSVLTRLTYCIIIICFAFLCLFFTRYDGIQEILAKIPYICSSGDVCKNISGVQAILRLGFVMALFHFVMSIILINVQDSTDCRVGVQNGFWAIKSLGIIGGAIGMLFVPAGKFDIVMVYASTVIGFIFIFIQMISIIFFSYSIRDKIFDKQENSDSKAWKWLHLMLIFFGYCGSLAFVVFNYVFFTRSTKDNSICPMPALFTSVNMGICVFLNGSSFIISKRTGLNTLLVTAIMGCYIMFITTTAIHANPDIDCNPQFGVMTADKQLGTSNSVIVDTIIMFFIWILAILFSCVRSNLVKIASGDTSAELDKNVEYTEDNKNHGYVDDECQSVNYSYTQFHLMIMCGTFFIIASFIDWYNYYQLKGDGEFMKSEATMWIKIASSWLCALLYMWTLIAPLILKNRQF
ncbi:Serine incorporator 5 [Intoshia linei]|uniref:Serine incorporator 5 n=1 Tax=Intoshia linei TaxID=1819745 RepID=A0A177B546_9BILA|nr:Serine incorporator 5 [Intoshia linei]